MSIVRRITMYSCQYITVHTFLGGCCVVKGATQPPSSVLSAESVPPQEYRAVLYIELCVYRALHCTVCTTPTPTPTHPHTHTPTHVVLTCKSLMNNSLARPADRFTIVSEEPCLTHCMYMCMYVHVHAHYLVSSLRCSIKVQTAEPLYPFSYSSK